MSAISEEGAGEKDVGEIFTFWKPKQRAGQKSSNILQLTPKQHDAVYALAGCADVMYNISKISQRVREGVCVHVVCVEGEGKDGARCVRGV